MKGTTTAHAALAVLAAMACGAAPVRHHVPERLDKVRLIHPAAARKNHILLVNVGKAVPDEHWALSATYAVSRLQLNVWTNAADSVDVAAYATDSSRGMKAFGEKAKVCLFVVDDPKLANIVGAPGCWCAINVCNLRRDNPDRQTLRDRYAKTILKGLAYACGSGASIEPNCSLFYGSVTLAGMDGTGIMIAPPTYFPMLEVLKVVGGVEMLTPAIEE